MEFWKSDEFRGLVCVFSPQSDAEDLTVLCLLLTAHRNVTPCISVDWYRRFWITCYIEYLKMMAGFLRNFRYCLLNHTSSCPTTQ